MFVASFAFLPASIAVVTFGFLVFDYFRALYVVVPPAVIETDGPWINRMILVHQMVLFGLMVPATFQTIPPIHVHYIMLHSFLLLILCIVLVRTSRQFVKRLRTRMAMVKQ